MIIGDLHSGKGSFSSAVGWHQCQLYEFSSEAKASSLDIAPLTTLNALEPRK